MTLILWLRFWLSALLVALAVILLAVAQRVDEGPVAYWLRSLLAEMAVGLDKADPRPEGKTNEQRTVS